VAVQPRREDLLAAADRVLAAHAVEAGGAPEWSSHSTMKAECVGVEAVGVRLEDAVLVLDEGEGEGVEEPRGAEPGEPGVADVEVGPEVRRRSFVRMRLLIPSAATTRSASPRPSEGSHRSRPGRRRRSAARRRAQRRAPAGSAAVDPGDAAEAVPPEVIVRPRTWTSMSSQCAKLSAIRR
jgi:hypothetical protein